MTEIKFYGQDGKLSGFEVSGHSASSESDIVGRTVCAAVSSAAYMTANTLTEIIGVKAVSRVDDGYMSVKLTSKSEESQAVLKGFQLHANELAKQYRKYLKVYSEV